MIVRSPRERAAAAPSARVWSLPTQSRMTSAPTGRGADLLGRALPGQEGVLRAMLLGKLERVGPGVHSEDAGRRRGLEQLNRQMPESTDSDDNRVGAGRGFRPRTSHR